MATIPTLPAQFAHAAPVLTYQGAEAQLYKTTFPLSPSSSTPGIPTLPAALKFRPRKTYRHAILDARLTRHRILSEARVLVRLRRAGVAVPAVYALDWEGGWMVSEWIEGGTVRALLDGSLGEWLEAGSGGEELMGRIGVAVGRMHDAGVVHGDLTTSNLMLRGEEVVVIDFGLAAQTSHEEERAVDLYVLERAFGSTHPRAEGLFRLVLEAYGGSYKGARATLRRYEDVRMRGRKKIMIG